MRLGVDGISRGVGIEDATEGQINLSSWQLYMQGKIDQVVYG